MTKILVVEISENKLVFHHQKPHVIIYNFDPSSPIKVTLSIFFTSKTKSDETVSSFTSWVTSSLDVKEEWTSLLTLLILDFNRSFFYPIFFRHLENRLSFHIWKMCGDFKCSRYTLIGLNLGYIVSTFSGFIFLLFFISLKWLVSIFQ